MPHNESLVPKTHAFRNLMGQIPLTKVCDYNYSIKVDLIKHDDPEAMLKGTYDFVKATWSLDGNDSSRADYNEMKEALNQMLSGKALGLGLETVGFIFRISGISRIDTHQIVRQRIGVTFSQQCSGDQFWNHQNILLEPSIYLTDKHRKAFLETALRAKTIYASLVNSNSISIQAARSILPHCLETFIFMKIDLATLLFFHKKRIDDGSQTWQINEIAQQMADRVCAVFPQLEDVFEKNKKAFTFQTEASKDRNNSFSTGLYLPKEDTFDYHERDFLYNKRKLEMHSVSIGKNKTARKPFPSMFYWGEKLIDAPTYTDIKSAYESLNRDNEVHPYRTNQQIRLRAELLNEDLINKYSL